MPTILSSNCQLLSWHEGVRESFELSNEGIRLAVVIGFVTSEFRSLKSGLEWELVGKHLTTIV